MFLATLFLQDMVRDKRSKTRMTCTIAQGGGCVTGAGFEYQLTGKDRQKFSGREWWGKQVTVDLELTPTGQASGTAPKVVKARK